MAYTNGICGVTTGLLRALTALYVEPPGARNDELLNATIINYQLSIKKTRECNYERR
ncbi:MAG: hypothetical protein LBM98_09945 [Oscillospiraceae bacterium]|nr:hypothetical protein [Oscillospiraceae bacterium]